MSENESFRQLAERYYKLLKENEKVDQQLVDETARLKEENARLKEENLRLAAERDQWKTRYELVYHSRVAGTYIRFREKLARKLHHA